jgi:hypothetical protein
MATRKETPPKKTGKKGIGPPLDVVKDFDTPVKKDVKETDQKALLEMPVAEKSPAVVGKKIRVNYVRPHFDRVKSGKRTVALEISFALVDAHDKLLPKRITDGWNFMTKRGNKRLDLVDVPGQRALFFLTSDDKEEICVLPAAKISHVSLQVIEESGTGKAKKVIRLSFRLQVEISNSVAKFAEFNFGQELYMEMHETQEELFDEGEEEDKE